MKLLLSASILLLFTLKTYAQGSLEGDRLALVALYNSTNGEFWVNTESAPWPVNDISATNPCGWFGVTCFDGRVTELNLPLNDLYGSLPSEIGDLSELRRLNLRGVGSREYGVALEGNLPVEFANLEKLNYLDLSGNFFDADNIGVLGNLLDLKFLAITAYWNIPNQIASLTSLEYLDFSSLDESGMSGSGSIGQIPSFIGDFSELKSLKIRRAGATGNIPVSFGSLLNLEVLDLSINQLTGIIPASIGTLTKLHMLNLSYNLLDGQIPLLSGIGTAAKVNIDNNKFTFDGMEENFSKLSSFSPQAKLSLFQHGPVLRMLASDEEPFPLGTKSVDAGGALSNNTYRWYKNNQLVATNVGYQYFSVWEKGTFRGEVTNSQVPGLTLVSVDWVIESLPVNLTSFSVTNHSEKSILNWTTTSETDNAGFEIQRSADAVNFVKIGFVEGDGNSAQNKTYTFTDENPLRKTYYRLKQIDLDGKFEYSRIVSAKRKEQFAIYPNPVNSEIFVSGLEKKERVIIRMANGNKVFDQNVSATEAIDTSKFSTGLYLITIANETYRVVVAHQ